jgi:hypothetical protein
VTLVQFILRKPEQRTGTSSTYKNSGDFLRFWLGSLRLGLCNGAEKQEVADQITGGGLRCTVTSLMHNGELLGRMHIGKR